MSTELEFNERKSVKEASFLSKINTWFVFNTLLCPFLAQFSYFSFGKGMPSDTAMTQTLKDLNGFYTRYIIQVGILCFLNQMLTDNSLLLKGYKKMAKDNGKTNFDQWFYDLSFKSSALVSIFTFGLFFSIIYPQVLIVVTTIFIV